jgi:hypothetical protein
MRRVLTAPALIAGLCLAGPVSAQKAAKEGTKEGAKKAGEAGKSVGEAGKTFWEGRRYRRRDCHHLQGDLQRRHLLLRQDQRWRLQGSRRRQELGQVAAYSSERSATLVRAFFSESKWPGKRMSNARAISSRTIGFSSPSSEARSPLRTDARRDSAALIMAPILPWRCSTTALGR